MQVELLNIERSKQYHAEKTSISTRCTRSISVCVCMYMWLYVRTSSMSANRSSCCMYEVISCILLCSPCREDIEACPLKKRASKPTSSTK